MSMQREHTTVLESQLAAKNEESATLIMDLARMHTTHKQAVNKYRDALGKAAKKCGVAVVFLRLADRITHVATPRSNPSWTVSSAPQSRHH